jgi:predicted esterase
MSTLIVFLHGSKGVSSHLHDILSSRTLLSSVSSNGQISHQTFLSQAHEYGYDLICPQAINIIRPLKADELRYGWFDRAKDFKTEGIDGEYEDTANMRLSAAHICDTILKYEKNKHTVDHIIIGGMSRGGGMALELLCYLQDYPSILARLRGIFVHCSYLLKSSQVYRTPKVLPQLPILMMHGQRDPLIDYSWSKATAKNLISCGYSVDFKSYPNGVHRLEPEMVSLGLYLFPAYHMTDYVTSCSCWMH